MALEEQNEWTKSNFCKGPLKMFPPEPFRWLGAMIIRNAIRRKEMIKRGKIQNGLINNFKIAVSVGSR